MDQILWENMLLAGVSGVNTVVHCTVYCILVQVLLKMHSLWGNGLRFWDPKTFCGKILACHFHICCCVMYKCLEHIQLSCRNTLISWNISPRDKIVPPITVAPSHLQYLGVPFSPSIAFRKPSDSHRWASLIETLMPLIVTRYSLIKCLKTLTVKKPML
jgi:hypothetical protein